MLNWISNKYKKTFLVKTKSDKGTFVLLRAFEISSKRLRYGNLIKLITLFLKQKIDKMFETKHIYLK